MRAIGIAAQTVQDARRRLDQAQQPLYVSLSHLFRSEIAEGRWTPGAQIPTIAHLSERYDVARMTVRHALGVLSAAGLIEPVQGRGTFVADNAKRRKIIELDSDWNSFLKMLDGNLPELIDVKKSCDLPAQARDQGRSGGDYRYMKRVHRSDNEAYCVNEVYLANSYYRRAQKAFDTQMVIPNLWKLARSKLEKMKQSFRITSADLFVAQALDVPLNAPIGEVRRVITNRDGEILYYGYGQYRGDLVVFNTTINVAKG